MTKLEQDIFFAIIRAAIWTDDQGQPTADRLAEAARLVPDGYDWSTLIHSYEDHAMLGVVAHAILQMPSAKRPIQSQQDHLMSHVAQLVRQRFTMRQTITQVFTALEESGCHPILLKGEGLATLHPSTCHRSVGDIDVYVGQEKYPEAKAVINRLSSPEAIQCAMEDPHQYHIDLTNGITVEVHPIAGLSAVERHQSRYVRWAEQALLPDRCTPVQLADRTILTPPTQFCLVYLFDHLCRHLRFEGIGLRQFIDIALVLRLATSAPDFDPQALRRHLQSLGLFRAWQIFAGIFVHQLGIAPHAYPFYDPQLASLSQGQLLSVILSDGNFGHQSQWRVHVVRQHLMTPTDRYRMQFRIARLEYILFPGDVIRHTLIKFLGYPFRLCKRTFRLLL